MRYVYEVVGQGYQRWPCEKNALRLLLLFSTHSVAAVTVGAVTYLSPPGAFVDVGLWPASAPGCSHSSCPRPPPSPATACQDTILETGRSGLKGRYVALYRCITRYDGVSVLSKQTKVRVQTQYRKHTHTHTHTTNTRYLQRAMHCACHGGGSNLHVLGFLIKNVYMSYSSPTSTDAPLFLQACNACVVWDQ